jgi:predicted ATPase
LNRTVNSSVQLTFGAIWRHNQEAGSRPVSAVASRLTPIRYAASITAAIDMNRKTIRRILLTGGPGAGKTAMLEELGRRGYCVVPEVARTIIMNRRRDGLPPRPSPLEFAIQVLQSDAEQYESADSVISDLAFFDRGILDSLGMLAQLDRLSSSDRDRLLERYPYQQPVFIFPPWREIYRTDAERDQTFEQAVEIHDWLRHWYSRCDYDLLEVPFGSIGERCDYVLEHVGENPG